MSAVPASGRDVPTLSMVLGAVVAGGMALASALWVREAFPSSPPPRAAAAADVGFCQDMAAHHDQAVLMAILALDRAGPTVKAIASSILVSQSQETGILRGWLQLWNQPPIAPAATPGSQVNSGRYCLVPRQGAMPGMASPKELNELWRDSGSAFDILFLQLMIRHHEGGILMSREAQLTAKLGLVRNTAAAMIAEQTQELAEMRRILEADGAQPLPR